MPIECTTSANKTVTCGQLGGLDGAGLIPLGHLLGIVAGDQVGARRAGYGVLSDLAETHDGKDPAVQTGHVGTAVDVLVVGVLSLTVSHLGPLRLVAPWSSDERASGCSPLLLNRVAHTLLKADLLQQSAQQGPVSADLGGGSVKSRRPARRGRFERQTLGADAIAQLGDLIGHLADLQEQPFLPGVRFQAFGVQLGAEPRH